MLKHSGTGVCLAMDFRNDSFIVEAILFVRLLQWVMSVHSKLMCPSYGLKLKRVGMKQFEVSH